MAGVVRVVQVGEVTTAVRGAPGDTQVAEGVQGVGVAVQAVRGPELGGESFPWAKERPTSIESVDTVATPALTPRAGAGG
jgi:hypothetical protein